MESSKRETITKSTIHKITWNIESYTILEVTNDEGAINLLINIKYTVISAETCSPIRNTPHSMSLVFYETIVRDLQYNAEAATYHYI